MTFKDRKDAGRSLGERLLEYVDDPRLVVLGIPRGGVVVAAEIAQQLRAPLDVFLSQKLGVPGHEELAFGAVTAHGPFLNEHVIREFAISAETIDRISQAAQEKIRERELLFRRNRPPLEVRGRTVILVDDGVATGASLFAAIPALRRMQPAKLIVAVPVAPRAACDRLRSQADEFLALICPQDFYAVGEFYEEFAQVSDEEVVANLNV